MSRKAKTILGIYAVTAFAVLTVFSAVAWSSIEAYRLQEQVSSGRAFEQTVASVNALGDALQKSLYATDGAMCAGICSEAYADALSAEASISALPFSTQELENICGYLNTVGDYAWTLCREVSADGFTPGQVEVLTSMAESARHLSRQLETFRTDINGRNLSMDKGVAQLSNIGARSELLSASLRTLDGDLGSVSAPEYDGKYTARTEKTASTGTEEDMKRTAAEFSGLSPEELSLEYEYSDGRRCFSSGGTRFTVCDEGVETMENARLVSDSTVEPNAAQKAAADFLAAHGYAAAQVENAELSGNSLRCGFTCGDTDAVCENGCIKVTVALDDASIIGFDCRECHAHRASGFTADWSVTAEQAAEALPKSVTPGAVRKTVLHTPGGGYVGCYEFSCTDTSGQEIRIFVNASTGRQQEIKIS